MGGPLASPFSSESTPDPQDFDFDALLESTRTLTRTVQFKRADDLADRQDQLTRQLALAEKVNDDDRGVNDPTPSVLRLQLEELAAEWDARGQSVTVQERTSAQLAAATRPLRRRLDKLREKGDGDATQAERDGLVTDIVYAQIADCMVTPPLTMEQIRRVATSSIAGQVAIDQIWQMVQEVCAVPPAPFSPAPSPNPDGQGSAPS